MTPADFALAGATDEGALQFHQNLTRLTDEVERAGARLILCTQATAAHRGVADGLRPALGPDRRTQAAAIRLGEWLHATLVAFSRQRNLTLLDAYAEIEPDETMLHDYVHLTAAGHRRLAEIWAGGVEGQGLCPDEQCGLGQDACMLDCPAKILLLTLCGGPL
jgi:lysophospholipase L1-like esterase